MSFLNQFASYFSSQERDTELYALWSAIGVNMEKALLEEQNKINAEFTDINNFSEDTMRSWLAFFLQKIPYRTSATSQVTVSIVGTDRGRTVINKYDQLSTDNGVIYTLMDDISLIPGDVRTATAVQGRRVTETGTYSSIIKVQANNPDLNYLTVKIAGKEIPQVSYETSYDQLSFVGHWKPQNEEGEEWGGSPKLIDEYGVKGQFYDVIADGRTRFSDEGSLLEFKTGDLVVFDGENWQKSASTNRLAPIQFANTYAVPSNGYFAYYYNNYLYIKIFMGTLVDDPNGQSYEVSYIQSDGIQGQIKENVLSFVSSYEDINENPVELQVTNLASTPATNQPSVGKLGLYLKQRLYGSINVSSVPEYTAWFNAQPEVGDCKVMSDYEKYIAGGEGNYSVTGLVSVYLVDVNGNELSADTKKTLLERIEPYKDIAVLEISDFESVPQFLQFKYTTSTNESAFEQYVQTTASQYYNLSYLHSKNASLFDELDLASIVQDIQTNSPYDSTGLVLNGYHYYEPDNPLTQFDKKQIIESYEGEKPGTGWYTLEVYDENDVITKTYRFEEIENAGSTTSAAIYDVENPTVAIGTHVDTIVNLDLESYVFTKAVLKCYWGMKNPGILSVGKENGLRKLVGVEVKKV